MSAEIQGLYVLEKSGKTVFKNSQEKSGNVRISY